MTSAASFLLAGVVAAVVLATVAWVRARGPRSPRRSVDEFRRGLHALSPRENRRAR
jgi:hypothetical protein